MKKIICFVSFIFCVCVIFTGCNSKGKVEYVTFFDNSIHPFYILEYDEISILSEEHVTVEEYTHYSESTFRSAIKIEDVISEKPRKGYMLASNSAEIGSKKEIGQYLGLSSSGRGYSWYTLGFNVTKCEEVYIELTEKRDTFLVTYYSLGEGIGYGDLYSEKEELEKDLIKNVEEVGKQNIHIKYKN